MARINLDQPLQPSVLDRLVDANPNATLDVPKARGQSLAELRQAVRRDLEALLNTRRRCLSWPSDLTELNQSMVSYGIRDFTTLSLGSEDKRREFCEEVETLIRQSDPRFVSVSVSALENADAVDRTFRFRIDALMYADPAPEPIVLDSFLDPASRGIKVATSDNG